MPESMKKLKVALTNFSLETYFGQIHISIFYTTNSDLLKLPVKNGRLRLVFLSLQEQHPPSDP